MIVAVMHLSAISECALMIDLKSLWSIAMLMTIDDITDAIDSIDIRIQSRSGLSFIERGLTLRLSQRTSHTVLRNGARFQVQTLLIDCT